MSQVDQFAQLLRAAVAQGRRFQQTHPRDRESRQQPGIWDGPVTGLVSLHNERLGA